MGRSRRPRRDICGLKSCQNALGPGAADVGYTASDDKTKNVRVCAEHAWKIMTAPRGMLRITDAPDIERIPAKRIIIP